jgi:glycosyltransferase involved in cell wall biosynthesis
MATSLNSPQPSDPRFIIATHALTDGPAQALRDYCISQGYTVTWIAQPLEPQALARAQREVWQEKKCNESVQSQPKKGRGFLRYLADAWQTYVWARQAAARDTIYIGVNSLNAAIGILLRCQKKCQRVIYYVIDYTPHRFPGYWLNQLYQGVCRWAARHADEIWNLSQRMQDVHIRFGTLPEKNKIVPIGVDPAAVQIVSDPSVAKQRLVVVSTLYESKGVQLAIQAMPYLPSCELRIIGSGPYEENLRALAQSLGVAERVKFLGSLTRTQLFEEVAHARVALAPYVPSADTYTTYADPAKPKEYLACGTPVIITRVPWIAEVIAQEPMGIAIDYDVTQLVSACQRLLSDDDFWLECRRQAQHYMQQYDWESIFQKALFESIHLP